MMPRSIVLVFLCEICRMTAVKISGITQDSGIITATVGETITLKCSYQDTAFVVSTWYQQTLGGRPQVIASQDKTTTEDNDPETENRFKVLATSHLEITNLRLSDSATYYCGLFKFIAIEFGQGVFLHVKTSLSSIQPEVHQPSSVRLPSGGSMNLNCTVYAEPCTGEENLYWLRHGSSQPAVMYPSAGKCTDIQSERSLARSCTLNLAIQSVGSSDAGIYHCAVASCGQIVFGNGTEVTDGTTKVPCVLEYYLIVALAVSIVIIFVLIFIIHKLKKSVCVVCKGTVSHPTCSAASDVVSQDADTLHYSDVGLIRNTGRRRQDDNVESYCVYSGVKGRKE